MSKYMIKFSKEGTIRFISHLDLLRLFKRAFKRVDIRLQYSQGFNPHPKMSFAQPLSLGYTSIGEYLEFDTVEPYPTGEILENIQSVMPEGIRVFFCEELNAAEKTLAAQTEAAAYEITIPLMSKFEGSIRDFVEGYLNQDQILIQKHQKKTGKDLEIDIRPMILELKGEIDDNNIMITTKLSAGSAANLSPEAVFSTFCALAGIVFDRAEVLIKRKEIYFSI